MDKSKKHIKIFNKELKDLFLRILRISFSYPSYTYFLMKTLVNQHRAKRRRNRLLKQGIEVPPLMIVSITSECNLKCKGCYSIAHHRASGKEMTPKTFEKLLLEARDLGVGIVMLAGGEPFLRQDLLNITARFPEIIFPTFTNGTKLNSNTAEALKKQKNLIPILSIEGHKVETDERRGQGIHKIFREKVDILNKMKTLWGVSLTITKENYPKLTDEKFISELINKKCRVLFFVEYVPIQPNTKDLTLTDEQQSRLPKTVTSLNNKFPALFIALPGEEEKYGGCLAAGRGFIHINSSGGIEPCPFAPFSDSNIKDSSLIDALRSSLLQNIRRNHNKLTETNGGCTLWSNRDWVRSLME